MAKRARGPRGVTRAPQIEWAEWADGEWWDLTQGEDHDQDPRKAAHAARMWAARHGFWANVQIIGEQATTWSIQFVPRDDEAARVSA